jgi:hypothetical protein
MALVADGGRMRRALRRWTIFGSRFVGGRWESAKIMSKMVASA